MKFRTGRMVLPARKVKQWTEEPISHSVDWCALISGVRGKAVSSQACGQHPAKFISL